MKNKRYTQPNTSISLLKEKMGTLIERDILFTALLMAVGLLSTDGGFIRGLPFPWFITGPGIPTHYRPDTFLASLVCCALIVVFLEFINAVIRAATEPKAFSNISGKSAVYANTFDDNDEFRYEASEPESYQYNYSGAQKSFDFKDATNYKKALRKNERAARKAASSIGGSKQNKGSGSNANIRPLTMFILIFTISTIIIIFAFAATMFRFSDIFDDDHDITTITHFVYLNKSDFDPAIDPYDVLGEGAEYGVVADTYIRKDHTETNFAVNHYTEDTAAGIDLAANTTEGGSQAMPFYVGDYNKIHFTNNTTVNPDIYAPSESAEPYVHSKNNSDEATLEYKPKGTGQTTLF